MKTKIFFALIVSCAVSQLFGGQLTIKKTDGTQYSGFILVQNYGEFPAQNGIVDVFSTIDHRARICEFTPPDEVVVFIPPVGNSCAQFVTLHRTDSLTVRLSKKVEYQDGWVVRTLFEPSVEDEYGPIDGVSVWAEGYSESQLTSGSTISARFYLPKDLGSLTLVLYKAGYDFQIVKARLPKYVSPDNPGKIQVATDNVKLERLENQVITLTATNYSIQLFKEETKFFNRYYKSALTGEYFFGFEVERARKVPDYWVKVQLSEGMSLKPMTADLKPYPIPPGNEIAATDIPRSIPRVDVVTNQIKFTRPEIPEQRALYDTGESKFDPVLKAIVIGIGVVGALIALGFVVSSLRLKRRNEQQAKTAKEARELKKRLDLAQSPNDATELLQQSISLQVEGNLEKAIKDLLLTTAQKIHAALMEVWSLHQSYIDIFQKIAGHSALQSELLDYMNRCVAESSYDFAISVRKSVEDSESQAARLQETLHSLSTAIAARKNVVKELFRILRDLCERASLSVRYSTLNVKIADLQEAVQKAVSGVTEVLGLQEANALDPQTLAAEARERKKARAVGIQATDVLDLKEFLARRQKKE